MENEDPNLKDWNFPVSTTTTKVQTLSNVEQSKV